LTNAFLTSDFKIRPGGAKMRETANYFGKQRVVIEAISPEIDCGRFPVKRIAGDSVVVEADVFADGHEQIACLLLYRRSSDADWQEAAMSSLGNDRWKGEFAVSEPGEYLYSVEGWIDRFLTWQNDWVKRISAGQDARVDALIGAELVENTARRASAADARRLLEFAQMLRDERNVEPRNAAGAAEELAELAGRYPDRSFATRYNLELRVVVDPEKARFSTWYEIFPRSCAAQAGRHGTFRDCQDLLPYISSMGFDVLYLPPIHPVGTTFRKGKNNEPSAEAGDVGSPWAIGSAEGGHKSIHPQLGTLDDFKRLVHKANEYGMEIALDIAFQCTPDHPYVREHPQWFRKRPDGTIQYAENPPKKYQDIYPIDFETDDWQALWGELKSVFLYWVQQGVTIFRVDNPHTKAFAFWEWVIREIKVEHPEVLFLAEAFTRPKIMYRLAKLGFSQSYTYFTWRTFKVELTEYFEELAKSGVREFFRPNLWPNTPDILPEHLQTGGRPAFLCRLALAATLGANYGIYGPAYELCENVARERGSEEYLNSEKYELKHRDLDAPWSLKDFIARVNQIRRENPALQTDNNLRFHETDNSQLICYSKVTGDFANIIVSVVNLDPFQAQSGWITLDLASLGLTEDQALQAHDLITDSRYLWQGPRNFVELNPQNSPAHILRIRKRIHSEADFDYYL
jgi:starch synthase (maltosyl-transferring)